MALGYQCLQDACYEKVMGYVQYRFSAEIFWPTGLLIEKLFSIIIVGSPFVFVVTVVLVVYL